MGAVVGGVGGVGGALYYASTASTSLSAGEFTRGFLGAIGGGAVAGAAVGIGGPAVAEGATVAGVGIVFGGGAAGDTLSHWAGGGEFDPYRALTAGVLNVAGLGLGEVLAEPVTQYSSSFLAGEGVKEELAKALEAGQIRSAIASLLYSFPSSYIVDVVNEKPSKPRPCPTK